MNNLEKRIQVGNVSAAIFTRQIDTLEGNKLVRDVVVQKHYRDKDGKYQHTNTYGVNDIPKAILALQEAYKHLLYKEAQGIQDQYQMEDKP